MCKNLQQIADSVPRTDKWRVLTLVLFEVELPWGQDLFQVRAR